LLTVFIGVFFNKYAYKFNMIDNPVDRSVHSIPTIKGFGVVFFVSIYVTLFTLNYSFSVNNILLLLSILVVAGLGLLDDIKGSLPITKIGFLIVAYILLYLDGYIINDLGVFLNVDFEIYGIAAIVFTLFALVAFTNAFNLIDGLDGLSGLVSGLIFISFLFIGYLNNDKLMVIISTLFLSSVIVFLFFNWHPAKVFLGDSGSLMIGFVISILGIKSLSYIEPVAIFYIAAMPIFDSIVVFCRRLSMKLSPFNADKGHLHHILLQYLKGDVVKTVSIIGIIQLLFSIIGTVIISNMKDSFIPLIVFILLLIVVYKISIKHHLVQDNIN